MSDSDILSFLTYQNAGGMNTDFTSVKSALKWDPIYYSRTANASYGIGLAAVILNDEAMGYNSKIVFITDSSVSVDSRFLKLAINNKIPIYFFCIGDFNTAALIGYAQLTGGKAVIYLNPALNSEEMLAELTRLFGLDELDFVRVKNDGSRHYRAYAP